MSYRVAMSERTAAAVDPSVFITPDGQPAPRPHVVVGVDQSPSAAQALRWAADYVRASHGTLLAVSAASGPDASYADSPALLDAKGKEAAQAANTARDDLEAIIREVIPTEAAHVLLRVVRSGVADALLTTSRQADLLVIGSTRHGRLARALLGSVTKDCATKAPCPVVIVRGLEPDK